MTALMPRLFGDLAGWFETDFPLHPGHLIRLEDDLTEHEYTLRAEVPGMDPEKDIQVTVDDGVMTIQAERQEQQQHYGRSEFRYGLLRRSVRLPAAADAEHITARYHKGVLEVTVPLTTPEPTGRTIPVESAA
jgi:HSP20 family molecular chaperone IbpA